MRRMFIDARGDINRGGFFALSMLVVFASFAFGANGLNTDAIWTDELYAMTNMGAFDGPYSPGEVVRSVADNFPDHVPLFFLLGAGWAHFVGWTQFALRLMPALFGALFIAWMVRLGGEMFSRLTGLLAASLLGTSAFIILYIHDFRMYSLFLMLVSVHFYFYWRVAHSKGDGRKTVVLFALSAVALLYTHFFSLIFFAGLGLYHLLFMRKSRGWMNALYAWLFAGLAFLPYLPVLIAGVRRAADKADVTSRVAPAPLLLETLLELLGNGSWVVVAVFALVIGFALYRYRPAKIIRMMSIPLTMVILVVAANAWIGLIPVDGIGEPTRMRYFIAVWIPVILLGSACVCLLPRRRVAAVLVLVAWGVAGFQFYHDPGDGIMRYVGSMAFTRNYPPLQDYVWHLEGKTRAHDYLLGFSKSAHINKDLSLGKSVSDYYTQLQLGIDGGFIRSGAYGDWLAGQMRRWMDGWPYLLFAHNPQRLPETKSYGKVFAAIEEAYVPCAVLVDEGDLHIRRYVHAWLDCEREYRPIAYANGVELVDRFARYVPEQDKVEILTGWEVADEALLYEYNLSLQIITPDWRRVGEPIDRHLYDNVLKWYWAELSTAGLEPGNYRVMVSVYDRETVEKVSGVDLADGREDDIFSILDFTVEA